VAVFTQPSQIVSASKKFWSNMTAVRLRERWNRDFDLYRLKEYDPGSGYYSYTHNYPRVFADKAISIVSQSKLIVRIPIDLETEEERRISSNIERFLYGSFTLNDERMTLMGMPTLKNQMAWLACLRGRFFVLVYVHKNERGETVPLVNAWDAYNVAYGMGRNGLKWACRVRKATKEEIKDLYDITVAKETDVYDYWDEEVNAVVVGNQWGKKPEKHGLDYCPVYLVIAGEMPSTHHQSYEFTEIHRGESIFHGLRNIVPAINKTTSDLLTIVRRGVKPPLGYWSAGGEKMLEQDIYQVEKAGVIPLDSTTNETIKPIITPAMPQDMSQLLKFMTGDEQRAGFPYTVFGELNFRLSGFAINTLQTSISTVVAPYLEAVENAYRIASIELPKQYSAGGFEPIKVRGRTSRNEVFGLPKPMLIRPSDIAGDWHPEVRLEAILPKDDAQRYLLAKAAREGEIPLLSDQTIRDQILGVEDPDLESDRVAREWADNLLINRLYKAFLAALDDGRTDLARNLLTELRRLLGQGQVAQPRRPQSQSMGALEQFTAENSGMGMPPESMEGMPPEVLPPESMGGAPGGALGSSGGV